MVQHNSSVLPVLIGKAKTADQEKKKKEKKWKKKKERGKLT